MSAESINKLLKEHDGITTLGELRRVTAELPDETPVHDGMQEPLCVSIFPEPGPSGFFAVVR